MLSEFERRRAVELLEAAHQTNQPIGSLKRTYPDMDIDDAYAVQKALVDRQVRMGSTIIGYKVGLTSEVMQRSVGVDEPDLSALLDRHFLPNNSTVSRSTYLDPHLEIELAFVMGASLPAGADHDAAMTAVESVVACIEIIDHRIVDRIGVVDTVADMASCGSVVLGTKKVDIESIDHQEVTGTLERNGHQVCVGDASAVLGDPLNALIWLADTLDRHGARFEPGDIVLTGSFVPIQPTSEGDRFVARFSDGLGEVDLRFT
ncbi:MAG: 4-oxalocrotonate decarboxylase [Actinomycetia bacterium]|nr:4-oxalocrotonate decarboxylase [Actinomycetes bacterium]MCP3911684.1 4-oxalocrotonate decarboxylase [Actinomycetes bacterium]MCP4086953.1 4-oxalocrotonate decarboxylase [Actinomycetes bacterium]